MPVLKRALVAPVAALLLLTTASADAGWQRGHAAGATARAQAIRIAVPGASGGATPTVSAPNDQVLFSGGVSYCEEATPPPPPLTTRAGDASAAGAAPRRTGGPPPPQGHKPQNLQPHNTAARA